MDLANSIRQQGSWGSLDVCPHGLLIHHSLCSVKWAGQLLLPYILIWLATISHDFLVNTYISWLQCLNFNWTCMLFKPQPKTSINISRLDFLAKKTFSPYSVVDCPGCSLQTSRTRCEPELDLRFRFEVQLVMCKAWPQALKPAKPSQAEPPKAEPWWRLWNGLGLAWGLGKPEPSPKAWACSRCVFTLVSIAFR